MLGKSRAGRCARERVRCSLSETCGRVTLRKDQRRSNISLTAKSAHDWPARRLRGGARGDILGAVLTALTARTLDYRDPVDKKTTFIQCFQKKYYFSIKPTRRQDFI